MLTVEENEMLTRVGPGRRLENCCAAIGIP